VTQTLPTAAFNHLALTVTDLPRALDFYTSLLGFQKVMDLGDRRVLLANGGGAILALTLAADPAQTPAGDRFNENRVGLDHLSFSVAGHADMEAAARALDARGVTRGEIRDLRPTLPMYVMAFRDPDNIQLELTAPA
jgi:catechol 2,3-dioxygenase-like lactoylglutathione lyase family enzyme